ncbi:MULTISPECIES: ribosome hibernation-promoting factor, HPF/YfiA family [Bacillus]|uniref:Ribosome hibernation promoting factor n=2 Tax=Bacillus TaxID=1386 RepID=A0A0M3RA29_9BACI|nr:MULTISPECIES: ribosome-associated translation inhibitor RaiA [Bacillus]ALC82456.1 Fis family transcriptional regulator [Bacillus gobiensis]MBP1081340.1 ribosomal subunit interface protein [Bacillus capparidis]MED1096018.1 ribosome-associated translation inhibitor RaiA [Bacillus capparidis]
MEFIIRGENIDVTSALKEHVERKIGKMERYFEKSVNAIVNVNLKFYSDQESKVEVTIPMTDLVLRAEVHNEDMYNAVDLASGKLERQIRKHKTKVNRKVRELDTPKHSFENGAANGEAAAAAEEIEEDRPEIVRQKRFNLKPMDNEEAILQMNMLGHNFFVFTNAETNLTNVVYRRNDGKYGLIEPTE